MSNLTAPGRLFPHRHLLGIEGLAPDDIIQLLDLADEAVEVSRQIEKKKATLRGRTQINLFLKPQRAPRLRLNWPESGSVPMS